MYVLTSVFSNDCHQITKLLIISYQYAPCCAIINRLKLVLCIFKMANADFWRFHELSTSYKYVYMFICICECVSECMRTLTHIRIYSAKSGLFNFHYFNCAISIVWLYWWGLFGLRRFKRLNCWVRWVSECVWVRVARSTIIHLCLLLIAVSCLANWRWLIFIWWYKVTTYELVTDVHMYVKAAAYKLYLLISHANVMERNYYRNTFDLICLLIIFATYFCTWY